MDQPMGAGSEGDFRLGFDPRVRLEFHGLADHPDDFAPKAWLHDERKEGSSTPFFLFHHHP
jgi:hypothetical protein